MCDRGKKLLCHNNELTKQLDILLKNYLSSFRIIFSSEGTSGATVTTKLAISLSVRVHKRNKPSFV
jgi:hypothetical protein